MENQFSLIKIHIFLTFLFLGLTIALLFYSKWNEKIKLRMLLVAFSLSIFSFYLFPHLLINNYVPFGFNDGATHYAITINVFKTWPKLPDKEIPERRRIWAPLEGRDLQLEILKTENPPFLYPPGYYYLVSTLSKISGVNLEKIFWFLPLLVNTLIPISVFLFVSYFLKSEYAGLVAAVIAGTMPFFIYEHFQGQYPNSLVMFLIPLTLFLFLHAVETKNVIKALMASVLLSVLLSVQSLLGFLPPLIFMLLFWIFNFKALKTDSGAMKIIYLIFAVCALISFFWFIEMVLSQWKVFKHWAAISSTFIGWKGLLTQMNYLTLPFIFLSVCIFLLKADTREERNFLVLLLTFSFCGLIFQTGIFGHYSWRRFWGYTLLFGAMTGSLWIKYMKKITSQKMFLIIGILTMVSLLQLSLFKGRFLPPDIISNEEFESIIWMRNTLPEDAHILTSQRAYTLTAAASGREVSHSWFPSEQIAAVIEGRNSPQEVLTTIKELHITHIFINRLPFVNSPDWSSKIIKVETYLQNLPLKIIYKSQNVRIYKVE